MGNRFGIQGLGAEVDRSIRDVNLARISEEHRPTETTEADSCTHAPPVWQERSKPEFAPRYTNHLPSSYFLTYTHLSDSHKQRYSKYPEQG